MVGLLNKFYIILHNPQGIGVVLSAFKLQDASTITLGINIILAIFGGIVLLLLIYLDRILPYATKLAISVVAAAKRIFSNHKVQNITGDYNLDKAIASAGYAYNVKEDVFYSKINAWQRQMGYCRLYDEAAAPMGIVMDCEPIFFEYDNKKWLIEFWKGQYDLTTGAEIGIYTSKKRDIQISGIFNGTFYDCASDYDMLNMTFVLKRHGRTIIKRKQKHWWLTGFKLGEYAGPDDLTMDIKITLKNKDMLNAFVGGLLNVGYIEEELKIKENTLSLHYSKPKTEQPTTRTERTDELILASSKKLCSIYQEITEPYDSMPEKANAIKLKAPQLYKHIINIGKKDQIFWNHDIIRNYIGGDLKANTMIKLTKLYNSAKRIPFDNSSKFVIMSDVHRGEGDKADDFIKNRKLYLRALKKYYLKDFTYVELGDGEELWENRSISKIIKTHIKVYLLYKKFYTKGRLYFIYGNHDKVKQEQKYIKENLYKYYDDKTSSYKELFKGINMYEALVLEHKESKGNIFLLHGHQVDYFNDKLWGFARFLSRYLWRPLEHLGIQDPTRTAKVYKKKLAVERKLNEWIMMNSHMVIAGHTHKPEFANVGVPPYFNDGSCVSKNGITAIEIENGAIKLVRWSYKANKDTKIILQREIIEGPVDIIEYFDKDSDSKKTTA